jgi:Transposase domain (DUF772)
MLLFTITFGGLLLMMGHHSRAESLFITFGSKIRFLKIICCAWSDHHVNFEFIRSKLKDSYSDTGRPSIDPELQLRILLVGYLCGVTSERKLVEELRMHLAWRWFTGLGFDQEIPHHSTFSKNLHGRFQESSLFQEIFEGIVARCVEAGLVKGARGNFWTTSSSVIPPKKRRESMTENPFSRKMFRKWRRSGKRWRLSAM